MSEDLRIEDKRRLEREGIESDWIRLWESNLCNVQHEDMTQVLWSLSRNSFLEGYKLAREKFRKDVKSK